MMHLLLWFLSRMSGYVNKLTNLVVLLYFYRWFDMKMTSKHFINARNVFLAQQIVWLEVLLESLCHI